MVINATHNSLGFKLHLSFINEKIRGWIRSDVQKRSATCQRTGPADLLDIFSTVGRYFFSSYLLPSFSFLLPSLLSEALFYERHVKRTGRVKRSTVEMLIVSFIRVENIRIGSC